MNPSRFPTLCGAALCSMIAAGISHWWSISPLLAASQHGLMPPAATEAPAPPQSNKISLLATNHPAPPEKTPTATAPDNSQKEFYQALIAKMQNLQDQNRDLLDQLAETNRDLMKLEFRVDTHSESFRPLPTTEERSDTSLESEYGEGVLPPRATPVTGIGRE